MNGADRHPRLSAIGEKLEIDTSVIAAAKPTKANAKKVQDEADKHMAATISTELFTVLREYTVDYAATKTGNDKLLKLTRVPAVQDDGLVDKWADHVSKKITVSHRAEWDNMSPGELTALYFRMGRDFKDQIQAQRDAAAGAKHLPESPVSFSSLLRGKSERGRGRA